MTDSAISPTGASRRSQIYRWHVANGADFALCAGRVTVESYGEPAAERERAGHLGIADFSTHTRVGLRGAQCAQWLSGHGWRVPTQPNQALEQDDGCLLARLSHTEFILLSDTAMRSEAPERLTGQLARNDESILALPRGDSHCWFTLTGSMAPAALAGLCGVDLRPRHFPRGALAQTSIARVHALAIRADTSEAPVYHLLSDASMAEYFWTALLDAMLEFDGRAIGVAAARAPVHTA